MLKKLLIVAGFVLLVVNVSDCSTVSSSVDPQPVNQTSEWRLVFRDEFDGDTLNSDRWVPCYWWDDGGCTNEGNNERQWYLPENILVYDGMLHLRAREEAVRGSNGVDYPYTSGMVTTGSRVYDPSAPPKFSFRYGFAEIRAKLPAGRGLWPAFWLMPDNQTSKPEIDVMEFLGHDPSTIRMTMHYLDEAEERQRVTEALIGIDFSEDWHIFAIDWTPEAVIWYVDGIERFRYDGPYVPDVNMYLLLNLAVGGDWPGNPDQNTQFPIDYMIDYVRVWVRNT